jgi:SAM-dependent methyltransferase
MPAMTITNHGGSASINVPDYWWYVARTDLLRCVLQPFVGRPARVLDVGSADGPSVDWLRAHDGHHVTLDIDPRGLGADGVCGSALALPFADETFDVIGAFDVLEHCEPEAQALVEMGRVLTPGGRLLISVPAYTWAWSDFDVANGHHRRYTRRRAVQAIESAGLEVQRDTYAFAGVMPFFTAERLSRRLRGRGGAQGATPSDVVELPQLPGWLSSFLIGLSRLDRRVLRRRDLPFGSSVVVAARKPARPTGPPAV